MRPVSVLSSKRESSSFTKQSSQLHLHRMAEHRATSATSGDNVSLNRPGEKRTTSSARQPMTGLPLPERVLRKRNAGNSSAGVEPAKTKIWRAHLAKVLSCEGASYDSGKGLLIDFEFSDARPQSRCILICNGSSQRLVMTLTFYAQDQDPNPTHLFEVVLPNEDDLLDLRIYESTRCLELRLTPKGEASSMREPRKIWSLFFRTEQKQLKDAKKMVKRLENVTREMPEGWFSYRNYSSTVPTHNEGATEESDSVPSVFSQLITGGHVWNFTGFIASLDFQRALGHVAADAGEKESDPVPTLKTKAKTKSQARAEKKIKKHKRRHQARRKAAGQLSDDESEAEDNGSSPNPEDISGMSQGTQSRKQPTATADSARSTPSVLSQEYEVEEILDVGVDEESKNTQFQVQWVGYEQPTWEPANLIPPSFIENFYRERVELSQPQSGRGRRGQRRRGGRGGRGKRADDS